ncbi:TasA family protein [Proteinivorax hydrogeniformans]|uniref:TasA family protein n=1 Tax=Proteinivorax hydrogeniformans TaxID=1826727 RepID=A0AAU8HQL0_9FIRM
MKKALIVVLAGMLAFGAGLGTMAWFSDEVVSENNQFTAGTLELSKENVEFNLGEIIGNMAPGDVSEEATIEILNDGSLDLAWFGKFVVEGDEELLDVIYIDSMKMEFLDEDGEYWEPTDHFIKDGRGHGEYPRAYNNMADASGINVVTLNQWLGNGAMVPQVDYENMGALKPGNSYRLSFVLGFHESACNDYQNKQLDIAYKVNATQVREGALEVLFDDGDVSIHYGWFMDQIDKQ